MMVAYALRILKAYKPNERAFYFLEASLIKDGLD